MIKKLIAIGLVSSFWLFSGSAFAITPGNLNLNNVATLTYTGNPTGIQANASVKVNVVASAPTLSTVGDITKAENQSITTEAGYTVTATNNGFDTYTFQPSTLTSGSGLTDTSSGGANVDFTTVSYVYKDSGGSTITQVELGATALDTVSTATNTISVPSDGTADAFVNGLGQNDVIVISGTEYTITALVGDTGSGSVTLTLNTAVPAALPIGTGIFERKTFTAQTGGAGGVGNQTVDGLSTTYDVVTTLQSTLTVPTQVTATDTFQVEIVNVTINKYVRNVTRDNCINTGGGACTAVTYDPGGGAGAQDYYLTDGTTFEVTARPTEKLEYLLRVITPGTGGSLSAAVIKDVLADFTTFDSGTLRINEQAVEDEGGANNADGNGSGKVFPLDPATDDGGLLIQSGQPTTSGAEGSGTVSAGSTINIVYTVDVS